MLTEILQGQQQGGETAALIAGSTAVGSQGLGSLYGLSNNYVRLYFGECGLEIITRLEWNFSLVIILA